MALAFRTALLSTSAMAATGGEEALEWRIVNAEAVEMVWRVRGLQFFSDIECTKPLDARPNVTGDALGTAASDMTDAHHIFALRSMRGWESAGPCALGECHVGFAWYESQDAVEVQCLLLQQGETGLHAPDVTLQRKRGSSWEDTMTWRDLQGGKVKLTLSCPSPPSLENGQVGECAEKDERSKECPVTCDEGFGTVEPRLQCIHGAWFVPECLRVGTLVRLVAQAPELIKPYWVILDAALYRRDDCTDVIRMDGRPISSGEFVIKYASYNPVNAWDGNKDTSWASSEPCTPGTCYIGFRFGTPPDEVRCVRVEHPAGKNYQATSVTVQKLGASGWEEVPGVTIRLLPQEKQEL